MPARIIPPKPLFPGLSPGPGPFFTAPGEPMGTIEGNPTFFLVPQADSQEVSPDEAFNGPIFSAASMRLQREAQNPEPAPGKLGPWAALPGLAEALAAFFARPKKNER